MFHPHLQRVIVLAAGIVFLAYALSTDEQTKKGTSTDDGNGDGSDATDDEQPDAVSNVVDAASEAGQFGTWSLAVKQAGLTERLEGEGPFTIFAPTDDAFGKLGEALDELLADDAALRITVESHIVEGSLASSDLLDGSELTTFAGTTLQVVTTETIKINDSSVVEPDLTGSNGVIHGIDAVIQNGTQET